MSVEPQPIRLKAVLCETKIGTISGWGVNFGYYLADGRKIPNTVECYVPMNSREHAELIVSDFNLEVLG